MFHAKGLDKLRVWGCFKADYISEIEKWVTQRKCYAGYIMNLMFPFRLFSVNDTTDFF